MMALLNFRHDNVIQLQLTSSRQTSLLPFLFMLLC
jgi:hypothetical protein